MRIYKWGSVLGFFCFVFISLSKDAACRFVNVCVWRCEWVCTANFLLYNQSSCRLDLTLLCWFQEEIQDFRALRARFNNKVLTPATSSSQESSSPVSPLKPAFGKGIFPVMENNLPHQRMFPISPSTSSTGQNRQTPFLGAEPVASSSSSSYSSSIAPRTHSLPRAMSYSGFKATNHSPDFSRVTQTSKQNMMPRNQRPAALKPALTPPLGSARSPAVTPTSTPVPHRQQQRQRSTGEVTPLRRALPPEKPLPLKPKRPPNVNLEAFKKITHRPGPSANNRCDSECLCLYVQ